jgi:hypothetical protein
MAQSTSISNYNLNMMPNVDVSVSTQGTNNTTTVAVLTATSGRTNVLTGFDVTFTGAASTTAATLTIANIGTANIVYNIPAGTLLNPLIVQLASMPQICSAGAGAAITATVTPMGAGTACSINLYGFQV